MLVDRWSWIHRVVRATPNRLKPYELHLEGARGARMPSSIPRCE